MYPKIVIETWKSDGLPTRIYHRKPHDMKETGHIATSWCKTKYKQWTAFVLILGNIYTVYGYSPIWSDAPPFDWSNDTY